ncbi:MAG TPA: PAS domain S-box protein, partial [Terriglobales bacterium]|nr:PAS domain S-box protein [Terriglobales bacterium]
MVADEIDGNHLLLRRIRAALLWILLSLSLFTLADVLFGRPGLSIGLVLKLVEVVVLFVAYQRARLAATDREIRRIALLSVCVLALITVAQGVASGDALTTALLLLLLNLGTATLFPWGAGCQLVTALTTAVCLGLNSWIAHGQLFGFGIFPALGGIVSLIGSVFLAYELDRYRRAIAVEMSRRDRSEAEMRRQRDELREAHRLLEQRSERRFRTLIEKSLDLVSIVGPDGRYLYANPVHASVFGIEPQQLVGRSAFELTHPDDLRRLLAVLEEGVRAGLTAATVEYRLRHHDGAWHFYEGAALNLIDDPHVGGILVTGRDITQRELAKERRTLLLEFAQDIRGNFELDELLTRVQTRAAKLLSAEGVITHRWQPQDQCYRAVGDYG